CEWILVLALHFSSSSEDPIFTHSTARVLRQMAGILAVDCTVFRMFSVILLSVGEWLVAPLFFLLVLIGLALAYLLNMLSVYIARAADMKEEADATL
ncbi:MAG: DUF2975 domain-containing protein, partial [Clostridia bacterium]|nr:DUF2975 domain-containing protein [Clostridia bacterium]